MFRKVIYLRQRFALSSPEKENGQGLVEYSLILGLVSIAAIVALTGFGGTIVNMLGQAVNAL